jgi:hypothetical protein
LVALKASQVSFVSIPGEASFWLGMGWWVNFQETLKDQSGRRRTCAFPYPFHHPQTQAWAMQPEIQPFKWEDFDFL